MKKLDILMILITVFLISCNIDQSSDNRQRQQQEVLLRERTSRVGMPNIVNFREANLYKDILELRDQEGLTTYTYLQAQMTGKLVFLGESVGYGIPYSTQFTNPQKIVTSGTTGITTMPQADPNGLFSPASSEGTWIILKDPNSKKVGVVYVEPRIIVSPFKLPTD